MRSWKASERAPLGTTERECGVVRDLARQVAEIAARPEEAEKARLWRACYDLAPVRPIVVDHAATDRQADRVRDLVGDILRVERVGKTGWRYGLTRGAPVHIVMKDTNTFHGDPTRVTRWCEMARRLAEAAA